MNALNILSGLSSTPPASPPRSRTSSSANVQDDGLQPDVLLKREISGTSVESLPLDASTGDITTVCDQRALTDPDEKSPLLHQHVSSNFDSDRSKDSWRLPRRIVNTFLSSLQAVLSAVMAPGRYFVACFYDELGYFSLLLPIKRLDRLVTRRKRRRSAAYGAGGRYGPADTSEMMGRPKLRPKGKDENEHSLSESRAYSSSLSKSDSDWDRPSLPSGDDNPARNTRSKTAARDEIAPAKKSIRIKLHNEAALNKQRRHRAQLSMDGPKSDEDQVAAVANSLKSPSSPASSTKLRYPRAPVPPRPLVPRRQPSYAPTLSPDAPKKTLIIDLDETLIHSMAKGGRMSTGHMVEVKFQGPIGGGGIVLGPQVPILYYVHERPHCHEFLRKVCKWYNLIVFTASVQEYADPVIDWLERERAYFSGRYYRQHCTFRNGAYIKDLSQVEPDLSKVMILDNSPMSYIFHEDNAIPIEGWISDPTDSDLLHLVPLLEGLQYVTDVRALLALRLGQAERS